MLNHFFSRIVPTAIIIAILTMVVVPITLAQSDDQTQKQTPRQIADFEFQYEKYREYYPEYVKKRDEFLQFETLSAQNDAIVETQRILEQRGQTLRTYYYALKYQINKNPGIDITEKSRISENLDNEIGWLVNHIDDVSGLSNPSLSQLFEISGRLEKKEKDIRITGYEARAFNIIGKVRSLYSKFITANNNLEPYIQQGSEKSGFLNNWINEAQSSGHKALEAIKRAEDSIEKLSTTGGSEQQTITTFTKIQDEAQNAKRHLAKGSEFQLEIIQELDNVLPREEITTEPDPLQQPDQESQPESDKQASPSAQPEEEPTQDDTDNQEPDQPEETL